jgi:phage terminase large subunit
MELSRDVIEQTLQKRLGNLASFNLNNICFKEQLDFINDPSPFMTACCSRRAGKTEVCAIDLLNTAIKNPGVICLYITMTRTNAERIVWKKLLSLNEQYKLLGMVNISKLSISFPNGSIIFLSGCSDKSELDKFRGLALKLVYIDEVQSFKSFISELVDEVLGPALADYAGKLKLIGTPGPVNAGFFFDTIHNKEFSHHFWTFWNNPFIEKLSGTPHKEVLDRELKRRGVDVFHPSVRREWFGEWVVDTESLVFHYEEKNHYEELPKLTDYVIGVDLGFEDADAIAVMGWHKYFKQCYLVEEKVVKQQGITELTGQIAELIQKYDPLRIVMDTGGLGKKIADELRRRSSLPIQAAEKTRKHEYIELLNDALRTGSFFAKKQSRFAQDSKLIEWDFDKTTPDKRVIKSEPHSDICDAVLYAYREALHWLSEPAKPVINIKDQWIEHTQRLMDESLDRQIQLEAAKDNFDDSLAMMELGLEDNPLSYYLNKRRK